MSRRLRMDQLDDHEAEWVRRQMAAHGVPEEEGWRVLWVERRRPGIGLDSAGVIDAVSYALTMVFIAIVLGVVLGN